MKFELGISVSDTLVVVPTEGVTDEVFYAWEAALDAFGLFSQHRRFISYPHSEDWNFAPMLCKLCAWGGANGHTFVCSPEVLTLLAGV
jgi:hypothetical protein